MRKFDGKHIIILLSIVLLWTLIITLFLYSNNKRERKQTEAHALTEAISTHNYDLNFRSWVSSHGGFYIPVTEDLKPNPYLKNIEEQNITTSKGQALTLMNPAWAIRSLNEFDINSSRATSHITSLNLIRQGNAPDEWETNALKSFENGESVVTEITTKDGKPYFRYMRPLITQQSCLKCHGDQGYKVGDIRGGISVSVSYQPYLDTLNETISKTTEFFIIVYVIGLVMIFISSTLIGNRNYTISHTQSLLKESNTALEKEVSLSRMTNEKLKQEITEHNKAEKELKEANEIINRSSSVIVLWNYNRKMSISYISKNIYRLSGYNSEDFIDQPDLLHKTIHPQDRDRIYNSLLNIEQNDGSIKIDPFRLICKDGSEKWVNCQTRLRRDLHNKKTHIEGILTDISENIRMTEEREKLQIQLNYKTKMDGLGQLAGGVAHDFNNILNGISSAAELIKLKQNKTGVEPKYANIIIQASNRAAELTEKLLVYSKIDKVDFKSMNIHNIIDECTEIAKNTINRKINLIIHKSAENAVITGNEAELENALMNLLINASHAIKENGTINIITRNVLFHHDFYDFNSFEVKAGEYCQIEVSDSGCGIEEDLLEKIFEPFFTTKEPGKGTGLGLTTVYSTVKKHNGSLDVQSSKEKGTTFLISFPVSEETGISRIEEKETYSGTGTVLFVDDEEMNRVLIPELLESLGYEVVVAVNGKDALEKYIDLFPKVDVVLLDMIMPVMDGYETFIKLLEFDEHCKIIISSGFTNNDKVDWSQEPRLMGFIRKPYKISEMSKILQNTIGSKIS